MLHLRLKALEELRQKAPVESSHVGKTLSAVFGEDVFGDAQLKEKLPPSSYDAFQKALETGHGLDPNIADQIANAMKEWALAKGATHFTHWFQPLTGLTAEKHDSFMSYSNSSYHPSIKLNFTGKQLIKGEPDASSFPSGGIRTTFEARGYTAWDMESPSFVRSGPNGSFLCIPTAFASWTGEALDMRTPLLRSNQALSNASVRVLALLGYKDVKSAWSQLGVEQEFFVIDRGFYLARPDLMLCGRTLLGAKPSKGQQMEDHYFGCLDRRILAFMQDVEWRLWRLAVPSTTRHNEVAPSQYELAPIFQKSSVACDHNMLTMELLKEVAREHGLACLLHEKPFAGVNGSGKHHNWSITTDTGVNLMDPGSTPTQNERFIVFLAAVMRAVSVHGDLLRIATCVPGNDHRLGANEAPPAIMSIFLGDQLTNAVEDVLEDAFPSGNSGNSNGHNDNPIHRAGSKMHLGATTLPSLPRDATDRNRTSPFAFTGNKFEFRAVGSSQTCARPGMILNSIVAESLNYIADELEKELKIKPKDAAVTAVVGKIFKEHKRVIFDGNGYSNEWKIEAARRGLLNLRTLPEAVDQMASLKNIELFNSLGVLSATELKVQQHTIYEIFSKTIDIESDCMLTMVTSHILPVVLEYKRSVAKSLDAKDPIQQQYLDSINSHISRLIAAIEEQKNVLQVARGFHEEQLLEQSKYYRNEVMDTMVKTRSIADALEKMTDDRMWPFPKYSEMLFLK